MLYVAYFWNNMVGVKDTDDNVIEEFPLEELLNLPIEIKGVRPKGLYLPDVLIEQPKGTMLALQVSPNSPVIKQCIYCGYDNGVFMFYDGSMFGWSKQFLMDFNNLQFSFEHNNLEEVSKLIAELKGGR